MPGRLYPLLAADAPVTIWSPARCARGRVEPSPEALRDAVDFSVASFDAHESAVQLSGGLDSSIVLSAMCRGPARPLSINLATAAAGGDERRYARAVASACGSPLVEYRAEGLPDYSGLFARPCGAHPFIFGLDDVFEKAAAAAAIEGGRTRMVTGQGGDAVFFQPATPLVAIDRVRAFGFGRSALSPLLDDARRMRSSIWHHLAPAVMDRLRAARVPTHLVSPDLLTPGAREWVGTTAPDHPWLDDAGDLPPGKRMQITMLANSQIFHTRRPYADHLIVDHPLLSQGVMEAVLPIPTYRLVCGRSDRGFARAAFADRLPACIVDRRTKGDAADHYSRAAVANLGFLTDALLDGALVRSGVVDRAALERVLTREHLFYSLDYHALVMLATCEAWASYWTAR